MNQQRVDSLMFASRKRANRLMFAGLILLGIIYALRVGPPATYPAFGTDNSSYLVAAKALSEGRGYRLIYHPEAPPVNYLPIGYPAFLSLILQFFSIDATGITVMRSLTALTWLIALCLGYLLLRRYISPVWAAVFTILVGIRPWAVYWAGELFSESLFSMWALGALLLAHTSMRRQVDEYYEEEKSVERWWAIIAAAGLCAGLAALTRTIGLSLIVGIGLALALNRSWRKLGIFALASGLILGPWLVWSALFLREGGTISNYMSYVSLHYQWQQPFINLWKLLVWEGTFVYFPGSEVPFVRIWLERQHIAWLFPSISIIINMILLAGLFVLLKRRDPIAWSIVFYLLIMVFYPSLAPAVLRAGDRWFEGASRYLMPVYIVLAVPLGTGIKLAWERCRESRLPRRVLATSMALLLTFSTLLALGVSLTWISYIYLSGHIQGPFAAKRWKERSEAFRWIKQNVPANGVIVTMYAPATYLFTDRLTVSLLAADRVVGPQSGLTSRLEDTFSEVGPGKPVFVFITDMDQEPLKNYVAHNPNGAALRWESPDRGLMIYEIVNHPGP